MKTAEAQEQITNGVGPQYVLATGEAAAYRLRVLHSIYRPGTRRVLLQAGLMPGMGVADLGCGVGMTTSLLADLVGPAGHVVGIDLSGTQIAQAQEFLFGRFSNVSFVEASAAATGLPDNCLDLVYCRFLLMHLSDPGSALREMHRLLKPGGILVCEDGDLTSAGTEPPSALNAFSDLFGRLGPIRGVNYTIGRRLFQLVLDANFVEPEMTLNQPVIVRGEKKRLLDLSVAEAGPAFIEAGFVTSEELVNVLAEMQKVAADDSVPAIMPRMSQVWARKALR